MAYVCGLPCISLGWSLNLFDQEAASKVSVCCNPFLELNIKGV